MAWDQIAQAAITALAGGAGIGGGLSLLNKLLELLANRRMAAAAVIEKETAIAIMPLREWQTFANEMREQVNQLQTDLNIEREARRALQREFDEYRRHAENEIEGLMAALSTR